MFSLWKFSHCHRYTLPIHIWESRTQCSTRFDMENVSSSSTFPGNLLSHWAEATLAKTIGRVWWSWQSRWGVIRTVLTHYFKQTERAPMRGIKERERKFGKGAWDVAQKRLLFSAGETIQQGRNLVMTARRLTTKNICEHVVFNIHMHIFLCHTPDLWKLLQACVWCSSHPFIQTGWASRTRYGPDWRWDHPQDHLSVQLAGNLNTAMSDYKMLCMWSKTYWMMLAQKRNRKNLFAKHFWFGEITQHWKSVWDEKKGKISANTKIILLSSKIILFLFWN